MRILVLGAGAIGGYFGGRLTAAGMDVTFLVRPGRQATLAAKGLVIESPFGNLSTPVATLTQAEPGFDAVLLACKAYDLDAAIDAIAPAIGPSTLIVPLLNGLAHLDRLDERFGANSVIGGLCHIGVTMGPAGEIVHLNRLQRLTVGARQAGQIQVVRQFHEVLARGGFEAILSDDLMQDAWEKYVLITSYAAMTCLMRAPIGAILEAPEGEALMREIVAECSATADAAGHPPGQAALDETLGILTQKGSPGTASMFRDLKAGGRTEHEHIIGDMLRRARAAGIAAPLLRVALAHLQAYEAVRTSSP